jgi:hypothetical protein
MNFYTLRGTGNYADLIFTGISFVPVYGDFVNGLYICGKDQAILRQENILINRPVLYRNYIPATGDVWNYSW